MRMNDVYTVSVRFHLDREEDQRAYAFLQGRGKKEYHSHSRAIIAAVDGFFSRKEQADEDPYLETREKEDAFLSKIEQAVARGVQVTAQELRVSEVTAPENLAPVEAEVDEEVDFATAMEFIDALCN